MATHDTGGQQQAARRSEEVAEDAVDTAPAAEVRERVDELDSDVDALLDEIDDVLEENAEDFVKSFVQKGGQ